MLQMYRGNGILAGEKLVAINLEHTGTRRTLLRVYKIMKGSAEMYDELTALGA